MKENKYSEFVNEMNEDSYYNYEATDGYNDYEEYADSGEARLDLFKEWFERLKFDEWEDLTEFIRAIEMALDHENPCKNFEK